MNNYIVWEEGEDPGKSGLEFDAWGPADAAEFAADRSWVSYEPWSEKDFSVRDTETGVVEQFTVSVDWDPVFTARKRE